MDEMTFEEAKKILESIAMDYVAPRGNGKSGLALKYYQAIYKAIEACEVCMDFEKLQELNIRKEDDT